jgi:hypothetical protein
MSVRLYAGWGLSSVASGIAFSEGDILGVAYGQSERPMLSFFHNGKLLTENSVQRIRGLVYPAASGMLLFFCFLPLDDGYYCATVADGATLEANFTHSFTHPAPSGYTGIIVATDMI